VKFQQKTRLKKHSVTKMRSMLERGRSAQLGAEFEGFVHDFFLSFVEISTQLTIAEEKLALSPITAN